jgi:hypothetical protein
MKPIASHAMKQLIFEHNLAVTLSKNVINPPKDESDVLRFYEWMKKMGNVYIKDTERMVNAFRIVALNQ